ncbi:hypothetical protein [Ferrimonas senticii]|uniref:hypothetical protein n=1 Tax=Ferrimonas senticii TaxID=394566 RepID=UPI000410E87A|nr:hypothetical protein [Ferrimonas senticii]
MRPLDPDFIAFLVSRTDLFLARYMNFAEVESWRHQVQNLLLPDWQQRFLQSDPTLSLELHRYICDQFGAEQLPLLRRRYNSFLHRNRAKTKAIDLDADAFAALQFIKKRYRLASNSEAICWMVRELTAPNTALEETTG